jgi:hypothetical protein
MRKVKIERMVRERRVGEAFPHRNRRRRPSGSADSGEKSRQPGGVSCRGNEREMGENVTATYRRGRWEETAGIMA